MTSIVNDFSPGLPPHAWRVMLRVELLKLRAQPRVRIALGACLFGPFLAATALRAQNGVPSDTLFGRWVHESGYALPLIVLGFSGQWILPILVGAVAGDNFATEDEGGTWTTLLTRSCGRGAVFVGKLLAVSGYAVAVIVGLAISSTAAGLLTAGTSPVVDLSGGSLSGWTALLVIAGGWASVIPPALAFCAIAILFSVVSRSSWVGVVGPVILASVSQLVSMLSAVDPIRPLLPTAGFEAWHGLARDAPYTGPLLQSVGVSALWFAVTLVVAARVLGRRDILA